ncbi:hypothetical protein ACP26L_11445 [Paenibacillus sp. S-38]|uniref:hypothetical protein n=1 Tax=Paenibacillus sp. S-38 TaxID=3416710 RepID=UPI003CE9B5B5
MPLLNRYRWAASGRLFFKADLAGSLSPRSPFRGQRCGEVHLPEGWCQAAAAAGGADPILASGGRDPRPAEFVPEGMPVQPPVTDRFGTAPERLF